MEINIIPPPPIINYKNWKLPQSHYSLIHDLGNNQNNVETVALYDYVDETVTKHLYLKRNVSEGITIVWNGNPFKLN